MDAAPSSLDVLNQVAGQPSAPAAGGESSLDVLNKVSADPHYGTPDVAGEATEGPTAEEQSFLKSNPDHKYLPSDPKFPNRPPGIYPTGKGNEWRQDPSYSQSPVDLEFAKHTAEGAGMAAAGTLGGVAATSPAAATIVAKGANALPLAGPISKGIKGVTTWAKNNPRTALAAYMALEETGVLDKYRALRIPLLMLLGGPSSAEGGAAEGAEAAEGAAAEAAPAAEATPPAAAPAPAAPAPAAAPKESAEEFVNRVTGTKPGTQAADYNVKPNVEQSPDAEDAGLSKEQRQAQVDKYYEENPDKKPQPQVWQRGPKSGQPKTYKVFIDGKWVERQKFK